VKVQHVKQIKF